MGVISDLVVNNQQNLIDLGCAKNTYPDNDYIIIYMDLKKYNQDSQCYKMNTVNCFMFLKF